MNSFHTQWQGQNCKISAFHWKDHSVSIITILLKILPAWSYKKCKQSLLTGFSLCNDSSIMADLVQERLWVTERDSRPPHSHPHENARFIFVHKYIATFAKFPDYFIFLGERDHNWVGCASSFFLLLVKTRTFIFPQRAQIVPVCAICFVVSF